MSTFVAGDRNPLINHNAEYYYLGYHSDLYEVCGDWATAVVCKALSRLTETALSNAKSDGVQWKNGDPVPFKIGYRSIMAWCQNQISAPTLRDSLNKLSGMGLLSRYRVDNQECIYVLDYSELNNRLKNLGSPKVRKGWPEYVSVADMLSHDSREKTFSAPEKKLSQLWENSFSASDRYIGSNKGNESLKETLPPYPPSPDGKGEPFQSPSSPSAAPPTPLPPHPPSVGRGSLALEEDEVSLLDSRQEQTSPCSKTSLSPRLGDTTDYRHSLPHPLPPPYGISTVPIENKEIENQDWDIKIAKSIWKNMVPKAKWNKATEQFVERQMDSIGGLPLSSLKSALKCFVDCEEMRDKNYPHMIFWKKPQAWMPDNCEESGRRRVTAKKTGQGIGREAPTSQKPTQRDFVADWNRLCPSSPTNETLYRVYGWRDCESNPEFVSRFEELAALAHRLRTEAGKSWVSAAWVVKTKDGETTPNWKKVLGGEFSPVEVKTTPEMKAERENILARLEQEAKDRKAAEKEKKRLAEEAEAENDRRVAAKAMKEREERRAKMTPEELRRLDERTQRYCQSALGSKGVMGMIEQAQKERFA